jgi:hypothetical protein
MIELAPCVSRIDGDCRDQLGNSLVVIESL